MENKKPEEVKEDGAPEKKPESGKEENKSQ